MLRKAQFSKNWEFQSQTYFIFFIAGILVQPPLQTKKTFLLLTHYNKSIIDLEELSLAQHADHTFKKAIDRKQREPTRAQDVIKQEGFQDPFS